MEKYKTMARRGILRLLGVQLLVLTSLSLLIAWFFGQWPAVSALIGGAICILPTGLFGLIAFRFAGARAAKQIVWSFYWGEAVKLFVTIGLFALVFLTIEVAPVPFFLSFIAMQLLLWLAPVLLVKV